MVARGLVILLFGPKGAGKSTIGRVLERELGGHFLEVEAIAKRVLAAAQGVIDEAYAERALNAIVAEVERISTRHTFIVIETTGASKHTSCFIESLRRKHEVRLVRVRAEKRVCAERIARRDAARQIDVSSEMIERMHERTEAWGLPWDIELENDAPLTEEQILERLRPLLRTSQ